MQFIKKEAAFIPKSQIKVFVSGGGGDVADAVVACLNKSELNFEITIASSSEISLRHYEVDNYALLPLVDSGKYVESLMRALNHYEIDIFIPTIDSELSLISENAKFITSKTGTVVFIGESSDVMQFGDKLATAEFLKKNELPYPNTILADDGLKLQRFLQSVTFPIIAKPRFGHGSIGVIEIKTLKDLTGTLKTNNYILQEKLPVADGEYTAGIYIGSESEVKGLCVLKRSLINGSTVIAENVIDSKIISQVEKIARLTKMKYVNIQFAMRGNNVVPFEINPRFSGSTFMQSIEFNAPEMAVFDLLLGKPLVRKQNSIFFSAVKTKKIIFTLGDCVASKPIQW